MDGRPLVGLSDLGHGLEHHAHALLRRHDRLLTQRTHLRARPKRLELRSVPGRSLFNARGSYRDGDVAQGLDHLVRGLGNLALDLLRVEFLADDLLQARHGVLDVGGDLSGRAGACSTLLGRA